MAKITTKEKFIKKLEEFTSDNSGNNITFEFSGEKIVIDEKSEDGAGEIYLDISNEQDSFFVKIEHRNVHTIGKKQNHNDGIVLKVNLVRKEIKVFLFELKKQLRWNKLEKASTQLAFAYRFIKYLQFEECFNIEYKFFIVYKDNNLEREADTLKVGLNGYNFKLFESVYEKKDYIPIQIPFCKYKEFSFKQVEFDSTITI